MAPTYIVTTNWLPMAVTLDRVNPKSRVFQPPPTNNPRAIVLVTTSRGIPQCRKAGAGKIAMGSVANKLLAMFTPLMSPFES